MSSLSQSDVLVVPGGSYLVTKKLCSTDFAVIEIIEIIQKFPCQPKNESPVHLRLLSVCSGARPTITQLCQS